VTWVLPPCADGVSRCAISARYWSRELPVPLSSTLFVRVSAMTCTGGVPPAACGGLVQRAQHPQRPRPGRIVELDDFDLLGTGLIHCV